MAAKYPDVFAAAAPWKPITDLSDWYDDLVPANSTGWQLDIRAETGAPSCNPTQSSTCGLPDQVPFEYERRSPREFTANLQYMPLHLWHDYLDELVPAYHSEELIAAITSLYPEKTIGLDLVDDTNCGYKRHCYDPRPIHSTPYWNIDGNSITNMYDFLASHQRSSAPPPALSIRTDESKSYFWLDIARSSEDHWTAVSASYDAAEQTVSATIESPEPLTLGFNLGSRAVSDGVVEQAGMGLPETTYFVRGGGTSSLIDYNDSMGYLDIVLSSTGTYALSISALDIDAWADPGNIYADGLTATTIRATVTDQTGAPVPDGTEVSFHTSAGTFAGGGSTTTATTSGGTGEVAVSLTSASTGALAIVTIEVGLARAETSVDMHTDASKTSTPTPTPTQTSTPTQTPTPTQTHTPVPSETPTQTHTPVPSETPSETPTATATEAGVAGGIATATATPTATATEMGAAEQTATPTPTATIAGGSGSSATATPTATATIAGGSGSSATATPTPTATVAGGSGSSATATPTATATATPQGREPTDDTIRIYLPLIVK
jgi:hypothetical protein